MVERSFAALGRAVMYLRVATQHPSNIKAINTQREDCKRIAAKYGLRVAREYIDAGVSAVLEQQTSLLHLLEDLARQRDAAYVVTWDYSRLGESMQQLDDVVRQIADCGATVATTTGVETVERFMRDFGITE
jgi:DNA invertase Pin-like site-specific DNA recombinase